MGSSISSGWKKMIGRDKKKGGDEGAGAAAEDETNTAAADATEAGVIDAYAGGELNKKKKGTLAGEGASTFTTGALGG